MGARGTRAGGLALRARPRRAALTMAGNVLVCSLDGADRHDTGRRHPERASRLDAVMQGIDDAQLGDALVHAAPRPATRDELARVHDPRYLMAIEEFAAEGG